MADEMQGIMSLPDQPAAPAAQPPTAEQSAAVEQMRSQLSLREINTEMLGAAEEADPATVAEFKAELQGLELPPDVLDMLNTMVEEILDAPQDYEAIRAKYMAQGLEDLLPPEFDATFFGALNMAIDQIRGASPAGQPPMPSGVNTVEDIFTYNPAAAAPMAPEGFAQGGIASLGRNGDTMLAHINPQEAAMLRSRGGSGSINPITGLPEFFSLKGAFKKIGKAVKKFASSTVGRIIIGAALFAIAGPASGALFGNFGTAAVAAGQGFAAGAGTTLLAGGNLKESLKAGAVGALTAGAMKGITQGKAAFKAIPKNVGTGPPVVESTPSYTTNAVPTAGTNVYPAGGTNLGITSTSIPNVTAARQEAVLGAPSDLRVYEAGTGTTAPFRMQGVDTGTAAPNSVTVNRAALYGGPRSGFKVGNTSSNAVPTGTGFGDSSFGFRLGNRNLDSQSLSQAPPSTTTLSKTPGFVESMKNVASPAEGTTRMGSLKDAFLPGKGPSVEDVLKSRNLTMDTASALDISKAEIVAKDMANNAMRQYLPLAVAGLGIGALAGGFEEEKITPPEGFEDFMAGNAGQRLLDKDPSYRINYGGVNTTSTTPQYAPYGYTPPRAAAKGGSMNKNFPRKNGPINGPGTGTSDDVPAMLSDGEFVFTAKAVRSLGDGSRRKGAKRMLALMKKLEGRSNA